MGGRCRYIVVSTVLCSLALTLTTQAGVGRAAASAESPWTGHGPEGGRVLSVAVASGGTVFAGTASGMFRSSDNGDEWSRVGPARPVDSIAPDPRHPGIVFPA